jgi:hypothetical protein
VYWNLKSLLKDELPGTRQKDDKTQKRTRKLGVGNQNLISCASSPKLPESFLALNSKQPNLHA